MLPYINTNAGITVVLANRPYVMSSDDPKYDEVVELVESGSAPESEILDIFTRAARKLEEVTRLAPGLEYSGGVVKYYDEVLHNYAANRLVQLIEAGRDWRPLARFLEKLQLSPSKRVVDSLYAFLEKGNIPLTPDGDFLVYKAVRGDYRDIHSGTFDNSVGSVVKMSRNRVDEDPNRTCSAGLHVCSFSYLPHFSHANGHVMMCKVNPADVVAIPADYNDAKMRVARYEVVGEVDGYYAKLEDILGNAGADAGVLEPEFEVVREDWNDVREELGQYFSFEEAKRQAKLHAEHDDEPGSEYLVLDAEGFIVHTEEVS